MIYGDKYIEAGNFLRNERHKLKLSVFKVAKSIGISGNYLSLIERGKIMPSDTILYSIAEFYKKDPNEIFSLFQKVYSEDIKEMLSIPSIRKLLLELSQDKKLSIEEKEQIADEVYEITKSLILERK